MRTMVKNAFNILKPGGRYIGGEANMRCDFYTSEYHKVLLPNVYKNKVLCESAPKFEPGDLYEVELKLGEATIKIPIHIYDQKRLEEIMREEGFTDIEWVH